MDKRAILLLLLAVVSHQACSQSEESLQSTLDDEETQLATPDKDFEGSGAQAFAETTYTPLIEDEEVTTSLYEDDNIQCGDNVCTCSHEKDGEIVKITVDCSSKDLINLPTGIDQRVNKLFLQNNKLEEVPKEISEFKELEELNVNNNSIKGFAFGSVSELPKLRVLRAANNRLLDFPPELRNGLDLRSLEELDLGNNDIRETLKADFFVNMEKIHSLTLPATTQDLISNLCHRLGTTLEKVCMNSCNVDVEECLNYSNNDLDLLNQTLKTDIENPEDLSNEPENDVLEPIIQESVVTNKFESKESDVEPGLSSSDNVLEGNSKKQSNVSKLSDVPLLNTNNELEQTPVSSDNLDNSLQLQVPVNTVRESTEVTQSFVTTEATISAVSSIVESNTLEVSPNVDDGAKIDDLLRNAVNSAANVDVVHPLSGKVLEAPIEASSEARSDSVDSALPVDSDKGNEKSETTDDETLIKVGAASPKPGGGIDNSTIALIVAGMVVVVAGVTIKKNWSSIRNRFRPRQLPAAGTTETNGTTPEEVPLQNKSMA